MWHIIMDVALHEQGRCLDLSFTITMFLPLVDYGEMELLSSTREHSDGENQRLTAEREKRKSRKITEKNHPPK
jgi:hypothetical protein